MYTHHIFFWIPNFVSKYYLIIAIISLGKSMTRNKSKEAIFVSMDRNFVNLMSGYYFYLDPLYIIHITYRI